MPKPSRIHTREYGRYAAGLFAATVVLTGGVSMCLMIAFVFAPELWRPVAVISGGLITLVILMRLLMDRPNRRARDTNLYMAERDGADEHLESFQPRLRRRRGRTFGTNAPPSADGVRQIKEGSNVWHPSERRMQEYRRALDDAAS